MHSQEALFAKDGTAHSHNLIRRDISVLKGSECEMWIESDRLGRMGISSVITIHINNKYFIAKWQDNDIRLNLMNKIKKTKNAIQLKRSIPFTHIYYRPLSWLGNVEAFQWKVAGLS